DYAGSDSFSYRASDGIATSEPAHAALTITPVPDAPVGVPDAHALVRGGTLVVDAPGLLANDSDPDGDTIQVVSIFEMPVSGTLTFGADGSFTYVHNGSATT